VTDPLVRALDDARRRFVPDDRLGVFEVRVETGEGGARALQGVTTSRPARDAARRVAADAGLAADVRLLPDAALGDQVAAIATAAVAPLLAEPAIAAPRASEVLHGESLAVLERRDAWLRVRARDGYHGWIHEGYLALGTAEWASDWDGRATVRSLGCEVRCDDTRARLPLGARLAAWRDGTLETADGQHGQLAGGTVRPDVEGRAEARLVAPTEWALRWFGGAPYAWGGRTDWGCDCSGLVQAVFVARGVALPRDSDQQLAVGAEVPPESMGRGYEAGDLLFFAERGRVSHVAIWAGAGRIVHSALSRGGVARDDLFGDSTLALRLREGLVGVRRPER
jgi:cell wall-associated NlpC family hydrolase